MATVDMDREDMNMEDGNKNMDISMVDKTMATVVTDMEAMNNTINMDMAMAMAVTISHINK